MRTVCVALPLYDGKLFWETWIALRAEEALLNQVGWRVQPAVVAGTSLVHLARNDCVAIARSIGGVECLLFVDGDMTWAPGAVVKLLAHEKDIAAAVYPKKMTPLSWNVRHLDETRVALDAEGLIEVRSVGTGLMAVRMSVFDRMEKALPESSVYYDQSNGTRRVAFFECPQSLGEDLRFCDQWRDMGGKVYVDPDINISHVIAPLWSVSGNYKQWLEQQPRA